MEDAASSGTSYWDLVPQRLQARSQFSGPSGTGVPLPGGFGNSKRRCLQFVGKSLQHHVGRLLLGMAFQAWSQYRLVASHAQAPLVRRKEARARQDLLERMLSLWRLQVPRQKRARHCLEELVSLAEAEERRQAATLRLRQKMTIAEELLSRRLQRAEEVKLQRQSFTAWARHSRRAFVARARRAMTLQEMSLHEAGDFDEQKGRHRDLQHWAHTLRERSQALHQPLAASEWHRSKGSMRAILRLCWRQWQSWRRENLQSLDFRQERALLGRHVLPKVQARRSLGRAWRAWQRLCRGAQRPRSVWLREQHQVMLVRLEECLQLLRQAKVWLLRSVMSAWFVVGWLRPRRRRLRHLAAARLHAEAQRLIAATADVAPAPAPAAPEIRWTPLVGKGRGQGLLLSLLKSHDFWAQKASLRAWRLQVAKERAFSAMLELTLEDGETFLASPVKRPARHVEVRWADGLRDLSDSDEQRLRRAES